MKINRTNTILYCLHWTETLTFYRDIFQFNINYQNDWFVEFHITGESYLSVVDTRRASIRSVEGQGITLAWQVDDVRAMRTDLITKHVSVTDIQHKWGSSVCYLYDPEKHRIELWQAGEKH